MRLSFVILLDDYSKIKKKIKTINKISNTQVIVVGPKRYKDKFNNYIVDNLNNYSVAFNKSLSKIDGDFVNFSLGSSFIPKKSLKKVKKATLENKKIIRLSTTYKSAEYKNIKVSVDTEIKDTLSYPNDFELVMDAYFFNKDIIKEFKEELSEFGPIDYLIQTTNAIGDYISLNNDYVYLKEYDIAHPKTKEAYKKEWYTDFIKGYIYELLKNEDTDYIKNISYYLILVRLSANVNSSNKMVLNNDELGQFSKEIKKCLKYIPEEIILNFENKTISSAYNDTMVALKNKDYFEKCTKDYLSIQAQKYNIDICAINNNENEVVFDVEYSAKRYLIEDFKIIAKLNGKELPIKENDIYSDTLLFGHKIKDKYTFQISCFKNDINNNSSLEFFLYDGESDNKLIIDFNNARPAAKLVNSFPNSYWVYDKKMVITSNHESIFFNKTNYFQRFIKEFKLYIDYIKYSQKIKLGVQSILLRQIYRLTRPFYKGKHIWITFDKLYKGGDNGEYFYQYCKTKKDNVKCYYIINKNSHDYQRLKSDKKVVPFKSLKEYLVVLNSECVFATHAGAASFMAFTGGKEKYFRDLLNYDVFCLQHGLTIQDIPHLQNRLRDNTKLYFCASDNEINNLLQPKYDYNPKVLLKTGIPRYDGLKNNDQREILITPTWRSNMANVVTVIGGTRPYYEGFKETEYFRIFNTLINDKRLIDAAKKYNYRITYLIHPTLTAQIDDFDKNDYVDIFTVTQDQSYEKLLTESSLMVTDYSGVQYDFAYMRKPIIYFHPDELPPHYGSGGINYETEGFGPIIKTIDKLVDELIEKMKNNCENDKKYINRADKFFIYNDFNSCQRIYDEAMKFISEKKR